MNNNLDKFNYTKFNLTIDTPERQVLLVSTGPFPSVVTLDQ